MRVYRNSYFSKESEHMGYKFFPSAGAARKGRTEAKKQKVKAETEILEFKAGKVALIDFLNKYAVHADNG